MYAKYFKRFFDFWLSLIALFVLSPLLLILSIIGVAAMKGNPFFVQKRPGMIDKKTNKEKLFSLIKFRTMSNAKDKQGNYLPDEKRLNAYGRWLRSSSLDELPELVNILLGECALCGPRPLLPEYLERYSDFQRKRHEVRPGLTGFAQVHGRNSITWEEKFEMDVWYVDNICFQTDVKIILDTINAVLSHEGISSETSVTMEEFMGSQEKVEEVVK